MWTSPPRRTCTARAHVVDDDLAHDARGHRKVMAAIVDLERAVVGQLEIRLVHQRGRTHRVVATQLSGGEPAQFVVERGEQTLGCLRVARPRPAQPFGDLCHRPPLLRSGTVPWLGSFGKCAQVRREFAGTSAVKGEGCDRRTATLM